MNKRFRALPASQFCTEVRFHDSWRTRVGLAFLAALMASVAAAARDQFVLALGCAVVATGTAWWFPWRFAGLLAGGLCGLLLMTSVTPSDLPDVERLTLLLAPPTVGLLSWSRLRGARHREQLCRQLLALFSQSGVPTAMAGPQGQIIGVNQAFCDLLGYHAEELLGRNWRELIPAEDQQEANRWLGRLEAGEIPWFSVRKRHLRKDGSLLWVYLVVSAVRNENEGPHYLVAQMFDVTRWVEAEQELARKERYYRALIENATDIIAVVSGNLRMSYVSPAAGPWLGFDPEELLGKRVSRLVHPDDWPALRVEIRHWLASGEPQARFELRLKHRCGDPLEVEVACRDLRQDPAVKGVILACRDIRPHKEAQKRLAESQRFLEQVVNTAPGYVYVYHLLERRFIYASHGVQQVLGYSPEECLSMRDHIMALCHPDDIPQVRDKLFSLTNQPEGSVVEFEFRMWRRDGQLRWLNSRATAFEKDPSGNVVAVVGTTQDVTERKQIEEKLLQHDRLLERTRDELRRLTGRLMRQEEELGKILARELHDDVTQRLVGLSLELARLARLAPPPLASQLENLQEQVAELSDSLRNLAYRLHPATLDQLGLKTALELECRDFSRRLRIPVDFIAEDLPEELPDTVALCLYRVVQESLRNVARHAQAQAVLVRLARRRNRIVLQVQDDGKGFDMDSAIFRRGLGLTSMSERVRMARGQFFIRSRPGDGTLIQVVLPLAGQRDEEAQNLDCG